MKCARLSIIFRRLKTIQLNDTTIIAIHDHADGVDLLSNESLRSGQIWLAQLMQRSAYIVIKNQYIKLYQIVFNCKSRMQCEQP